MTRVVNIKHGKNITGIFFEIIKLLCIFIKIRNKGLIEIKSSLVMIIKIIMVKKMRPIIRRQ